MPALLIAMVNYNSAAYVRDCLGSIQDDVARIVVVDNASSPSDRTDLREFASADARVTVVASDVNLGFGAGVNLAVRHLKPEDDDVVVVLNPDTRVHPGALKKLAEALSSGDLDVVSPTIYTGSDDSPTVWFAGGHLDLRRGETVHVGLGRPFDPQLSRGSGSFITGAAPAMCGRTWRSLGGFREDLFLYWEDADLSIRATAATKRLGVVPESIVWHAEGGSGGTTGRSVAYYYYMQRNRILVLRPLVGLRRLLVGTGGLTVLRLAGRAMKEREGRWRKVVATMAGLLDGVRGRTGERSARHRADVGVLPEV
ncbi:glycosyltransferase family 2 protein [Geodermatophilus sp. SYSU D00691]